MFVIEWVAYYRVLGFDNLIVFTNDCTDGSDALLERLAELGYVSHFDHHPLPGASPQFEAIKIAMSLPVVREAGWLLHVDADEFLDVSVGEGRIQDLIHTVGCDADVIAILWKLFGHNGVERWEGGSVLRQFTRSQGVPMRRTINHKSLFRPWKFGRCTDHMPKDPLFDEVRLVNAVGQALDAGMIRHPTKSRYKMKFSQLTFENAALNHYAVKSPDLFLMKNDRGDGRGVVHQKYYLNSQLHRRYDRNEVDDRGILRRWREIERIMKEMRTDMQVRRLEEEALEAYRRRRNVVLTADQVLRWTTGTGAETKSGEAGA